MVVGSTCKNNDIGYQIAIYITSVISGSPYRPIYFVHWHSHSFHYLFKTRFDRVVHHERFRQIFSPCNVAEYTTASRIEREGRREGGREGRRVEWREADGGRE